LSLGHTHEITSRVGPLSRKTLALIVALVLSVGAFVLISSEAWAQQPPEEQQQSITIVTDGGGDAEPVIETPPAETSQVEIIPPVDQHDPEPADDPAPPDRDTVSNLVLQPEPPSGLPDQHDPEVPLGTDVTPSGDPGTGPESGPRMDPVPPVGTEEPALTVAPVPAPEPAVFEENKPLPSRAEEVPDSVPTTTPVAPIVPDSGEEGAYAPPSSLGTAASSAVETLESGAADVLENIRGSSLFRLADGDEGLIGTIFVSLFSGGEASIAPIIAEDPTPSSSTGTESSSKRDDTSPQASSPFELPVGSSSYSLSGGEVGPGGFAPILLCILVSSLILLRRDDRLTWVFCELPRLSSALCPALERPG
jgi:hypothetical protein